MLGQTHKTDLGKRDAFHCPAVLAKGDGLYPCANVRFTDDSYTVAELSPAATRHGIVDPFCSHPLPPGEFVWVLLNPGTASGLIHHFTLTTDAKKLPPPVEDEGESCGSGSWCN